MRANYPSLELERNHHHNRPDRWRVDHEAEVASSAMSARAEWVALGTASASRDPSGPIRLCPQKIVFAQLVR